MLGLRSPPLDVLLRHSLRFAAQLHAVQLRQHAGEGRPGLEDCILWRCGVTEALANQVQKLAASKGLAAMRLETLFEDMHLTCI